MDIDRLLVPPGAGVGSAIGFLRAPVAYEVTRSFYQRMSTFDLGAVNAGSYYIIIGSATGTQPGEFFQEFTVPLVFDAYTDYSVALTYSWASVDWSLAYVGTDLDEEDVFDTDWGEDAVVFSVAKSL